MPSISEPRAITGFPDPQRRHERSRHAGDALLHREAVLLQQVDQIAVRLDSWNPSSAKLKMESTICCVNTARVSNRQSPLS